ncbi:MAG: hypothetical protein ABL956_13580 [Hyphomonadaceae bacterium]
MDSLLEFLAIVGTFETLFLIFSIGYAVYLCVTGVLPVLIRLGNGLAKRRIAIFAKADAAASIKSLLLDSKLFKEKNICEVTEANNLEASGNASVYLVYWPDWAEHIDAILSRKPDSCALVVYQPYDKGRIADELLKKLDGKRHTAISNFRGRLLNDIVTSIITTSYEKSSN